jgi:hypothetical protein
MRNSLAKARLLAASLSTLPLAACSTLTTGLSDVTEAAKVAEQIGHVAPSPKDTCETQRNLAAQSSRIDTIIKGKETVYKPLPCKKDDKPEPKTS